MVQGSPVKCYMFFLIPRIPCHFVEMFQNMFSLKICRGHIIFLQFKICYLQVGSQLKKVVYIQNIK